MKTLFISDLHLSPTTPDITQVFSQLLSHKMQEIDALYILGDLFELWIGDDDKHPFHEQIAQTIAQVTQYCPVFFMHGNRDFLLGQHFAKQCGMQLLTDPTLIDLYGRPALLMHGDSLCTQDSAYQRYRKYARSPFLQKIFLSLPLSIRRKIADRMRQTSQQQNQYKSNILMDVTQSEVEHCLNESHCSLLIHGHTHQPAIHIKNKQIRAVLGAWHTAGNFLEYDDKHCIFLKNFYIKK